MDYSAFTKKLHDCFNSFLPEYIGTTHHRASTKIKADNTPAGDLDNDTLESIRALVLDHFPGDYTIGEEDKKDGKEMQEILGRSDQYQWSIDGLDGTGNLRLKTSSFGTMIARRKGNDILYAAIFRPTDEMVRGDGFFYAEHGKGVWQWCSEHWMYEQLNQPESPSGRLVVMLEGSSKKFFRPPISEMGQKVTVRPGFSSSVAITTVVLQDNDGEKSALVMAENKPWDMWPALLFIREFGGIVTDWQGNPAMPDNCGSIIATVNQTDHDYLLQFFK